MLAAEIPARAQGAIRARFERAGAATRIARLYEAGGLRLRFPRASSPCEAVLVNTGGGVVGGDHQALRFEIGPGAAAMATTQSAEKIYRSDGAQAQIETSLTVEAGGRLDWLPQETILFDGARLRRRLDADLAGDADALFLEATVFGRLAMREDLRAGIFRDSWRVRRDGRLIFAEETALDGDMASQLDRAAIGGGARASALLLLVAPDAEQRLDIFRKALDPHAEIFAASAQNGFLVARFLSASPAALRAAVLTAITFLRGREAPRVWR